MKHHFPMAAAGLFLTAATFAVPAQSEEDYDMDCKVILCLAGGFPSGCGDAFSPSRIKASGGRLHHQARKIVAKNSKRPTEN